MSEGQGEMRQFAYQGTTLKESQEDPGRDKSPVVREESSSD